jgi:hypothetical protein
MPTNKFYFQVALLLLGLVIIGFSMPVIFFDRSPFELPLLFHIHGITYLAWFSLLVYQAQLIGQRNYGRHRLTGYVGLLVYLAMLVTGFLMAGHVYDRGTSAIPDMSVYQFLAFPMMDLVGLLLFLGIGFLNRNRAIFHKHAMLIGSIAIMDPALARISFVLGFPPLALVLHLCLIALVIIHDRRQYNKVHLLTWLGLCYIIVRISFIFTVATTEHWAAFMTTIFGELT